MTKEELQNYGSMSKKIMLKHKLMEEKHYETFDSNPELSSRYCDASEFYLRLDDLIWDIVYHEEVD